jgi:NADPH-dependent curcumin reductase
VRQNSTVNRRIILHERPVGAPSADNFRLIQLPVPALARGQLLLRTLYLSLDPYMRGRMSDAPSYAPSVAIGAVMEGGTVSQVHSSLHPDFAPGDLVVAKGGWQDYAVSDGAGISKLDAGMRQPSLALGTLGMPGFTAFVGLLDIGRPRPGETVVVAAASGAVGAVVGQLAKLKGCRAVGIAGGADKCRFVVEELGFDACLDRRAPDLAQRLAEACPKGIDVYFESVGGAVFDAVLPLLNLHARVPLCGLIAQYNDAAPASAHDRLPRLARTLLTKRISMQGFIIFDHYGPRHDEFLAQMNDWVSQGKIKSREDRIDGLEHAPQAFIGLLQGKNFGKLVVRVAEQ